MHLFVEQLTNVDFSYLDAQRGIVGETWWASAILEGALDEQGMVCDFGVVKKVLRHWLDDQVDHRLAVPVRSDKLSLTHQDGRIDLEFRSDRGVITMSAPEQAVALVDTDVITAESLSQWCRAQLTSHFADSIDQLTLDFTPEAIDGAFYHYSHGLKKHQGNCQRIAHGHRSRIEVWLDGVRDAREEQHWADAWADIYLASAEDVLSKTADEYRFEYQAEQGHFALTMPATHCYVIDTDSTVEWIAHYLATQIKQRHPEKHVRVRAFEGVNKGAQAEA